jgi:thiamine-phosphate pyrophosphorylase
MQDVSPAIERAWIAAGRRAEGSPVRLTDLLLALLEEEEGRPAGLLDRLGFQLEQVRDAIRGHRPAAPVAPPPEAMLQSAREHSLNLRAEPNPTTEFLFLAALGHDREFAVAFGELGLTPERIQHALRSDDLVSTPEGGEGEVEFRIQEPAENVAAMRVVDANLNRSMEAFRVLDDYCRFVLNDAFLTERWKTLRHRLAGAASLVSRHGLLAARDTLQDVGTGIQTESEYTRHTPAGVALANIKRVQESLRSLEEFGKVLSADFARAVERIRYETYTLERSLLRHESASQRLAHAKLYALLTGSQCAAALDWTIEQAAQGGVDVVQMREKDKTDRERIERARHLRECTRKAGVLFIVNDRPDIARIVQADGVHLGQDDLPVAAARRVLGAEALIGVSTHTVEQVRQAVLDGADYIGVGPTFPSTTKAFDELAGLEFVRAAMAETSLPAFALGGIQLSNVRDVVAAGATRIAVSAALATADDPRSMALALRAALP